MSEHGQISIRQSRFPRIQCLSDSSAIVWQSCGKGMPAAAADLGRREVSVMPGMVLASRT